MKTNCYLKPAWTHNSSIRTDLPLMVIRKADKKKSLKMMLPGQLVCIGKVYLKTQDDIVRIR